MKKIRLLALIAGIAVCLTLPFALRGYHGDDSQFHFTSWIGLRQAWIAGSFAPGWDALANYTLGDPRFCFYPPISIFLGALLSTTLPFKLAPVAFVWIALVIGGLSMYAASESIVEGRYRSWAAILYMVSPYVLMAAITRFAVAELLVLAWLPLIVQHFLRTTVNDNRQSTLWLACLLALSWLTNLPASIVLAYVLLFVAILAAVRRRSPRAVLQFFIAESIAILVAAFYLVPAFFEKQWITTSALLHQDFRNFFVFGRISGFQRMNFELGLWAISCAEVAVIAISLVTRGRAKDSRGRLLYELAAVAFLFEIPLSIVFWWYLPGLRFVQFPFRFLSVLGVAVPLTVMAKGFNPRVMGASCGVLAALALLPLIFYLRINKIVPSSLPDLSGAISHGYPGTEEYTPTGAVTRLAPVTLAPVTWSDNSQGAQCNLLSYSNGARLKLVSVNAESVCRVRFATYFYPYWEATDEAGTRLQTSRDDAGLLVVSVPKGQHSVQVRFHAHSLVRTIAFGISALTILSLILGLWKGSLGGTPGARAEQASQSHAPKAEHATIGMPDALAFHLPHPIAEPAL